MGPLQEGVSPVRPQDYARVVEAWEASVRATHDFVAETDLDLFRPLVRDALPNLDSVCVRDADGVVAGYLSIAQGKVEMLFVHPDWRGQGVGGRLLRHAVETMGATHLDVNEQNPQAVGFYRHLGFEVIGHSERDGMGKPYPLLHMQYRGD